MEKNEVVRLRQMMHHLYPSDRRINNPDGAATIHIPLIIRVNTSYYIDEANCCVIWDDEHEILHSVEYNNESTDPFRDICPMVIKSYPYSSIELISARVDAQCLDKFFEQMVNKGLVSNSTRERYIRQLVETYDPATYLMGESPSTKKGPMDPNDKIMDNDIVL